MNKQDIALALKKARANVNMTCKEVAAILGNSEKTVSAWENGNGQPDISTLLKLCDIYKLSGADEMLKGNPSSFINSLRIEERDLLDTYRRLTTNSKQIVMSVAKLELNHVHAVKQGETPIKILQKTRQEVDAHVRQAVKGKNDGGKLLKVYNQSAAAGYGNYIDDDSFDTVAVPSIPSGTEFGIRISGDSMQPRINDGDIVFVKRQASIEVGDIGVFIYNGDAYCKQLIYRDSTYYLRSVNGRYKDIPLLGDSIYCVGRVLDSFNADSL